MSAWIFQANPNKYRIFDSLKTQNEEYWNLRQHAKKIQAGDRILIWISGTDAGIYALGTILTDPTIRPDSAIGMAYWLSKREGQRAVARVLVRYDKVFLEKPLLKYFLQNDPALWNLTILRSPRGTNFAVDTDEWLALKGWLPI